MEKFYRYFKDWNEFGARAGGAMVGAAFGASISNPFDILKTRIECQYCCYDWVAKHPLQALRELYRKGELGLGVTARLAKWIPGSAVFLTSYDFFKKEIHYLTN